VFNRRRPSSVLLMRDETMAELPSDSRFIGKEEKKKETNAI